jgi:hypothetical protein
MVIGRKVIIIIGKVLVVSVPARRSGIGVAKNCHDATTPHERVRAEVWYVLCCWKCCELHVDHQRSSPILVGLQHLIAQHCGTTYACHASRSSPWDSTAVLAGLYRPAGHSKVISNVGG